MPKRKPGDADGLAAAFQKNPLLFGRSGAAGLIGFEQERADKVRVYRRDGDRILSETQDLQLFLLLEKKTLLDDWKGEAEIDTLVGEGSLRFLARFADADQLDSARRHLARTTGRSPTAPGAPYLYLSDRIHQHLLLTGQTNFLGMKFRDLKRLQLDIETYTGEGFEFPNPARPSDRIIVVSMCDSTGWTEVLSGREMEESELLREMVERIRDRDPDVIEGHNLFRFDLEYIEARARRHAVKLTLGRDGSVLRGHPSRLQIAERTITYRKYEIAGRSIVDTWILAQHYDVATRSLPGYGLKDVARHLGVAPENRTYIPGSRISHCFDHDPDRLLAYALDDVRETRGISDLLSPGYFTQAQIFPYSYQNVVLRGNATKIDSLFVREYLHRGTAIPRPWAWNRDIAGGYTAIQNPGIRSNVLNFDVTSLYPSIMMAFEYFPKADHLGVLPALLKDLTAFRIEAKRMARESPPGDQRITLGALQSTFKILINSFYGYLGFAQGHFNDVDAANRVTAKGRELIQAIVRALEERNAQVLEVDTDGIFFVPPEGITTPDAEERLMEEIAAVLPKGIRLELAGRYRGMFNYKMKNYVLLDEDGHLIVKGSGLRSRGLELFQRRWMNEMFRLLLEGRRDEIPALLERFDSDLEHHRFPVEMFMKTETLKDSLDNYRDKVEAKQRNAAAPYELAIRSGRPFQPGDQVSYYVTGTAARVKVHENCKLASEYDADNPDENVAYYQAKLKDLYKRFKPWIEGDDT